MDKTMDKAIDLIKEMLTDLEAWSEAFSHCLETKEVIKHAEKFLEENNG